MNYHQSLRYSLLFFYNLWILAFRFDCIMTSMNLLTADDNHNELGQEFKKLASLIPTIPKDQTLSDLELIEFVIAYIHQLQQLLSQDQLNECLNKLALSMKTSLLSSPSQQTSQIINQLFLGPSSPSTNEHLNTNHRTPLATIHLDNTRFSWTVFSILVLFCLCV